MQYSKQCKKVLGSMSDSDDNVPIFGKKPSALDLDDDEPIFDFTGAAVHTYNPPWLLTSMFDLRLNVSIMERARCN